MSLKREGFADDRVDLTVDGQAIVELPFEPTLEKGKDLYGQLGCIGCHSVDGSREGRTGPSWLGLFGSKRKLLTGETVIADEAYLKESILNPAAKVAEGAVNGEAGMPIYEGVLNEEQSNRSSFMRAPLVAERIRLLHFSWLVAFDYSQ